MYFLVQFWTVFEEVSLLFILVPALLGLKGNLDMCLASRLSTQVNLGNMESKRDIWAQIVANVALVQVSNYSFVIPSQNYIYIFFLAIFTSLSALGRGKTGPTHGCP